MKNISLLLFLLGSLSLSAQQWQTELPYTSGFPLGDIRDFITTNDNGFLVLLSSIDEEEEAYTKLEHTMVKYDSLGNFEWDRNYDFGVSGPWASSSGGGATPRKVVQLATDNYMMTGGFRDIDTTFAYILITDSLGDSILSFHSPSNFNLQYVNEEVFVRRINDSNLATITKLNNMGEVIEEIELEESESLSTFVISGNGEIYAYRELNPSSYKRYNQNGILLGEQLTSDRSVILVENEIGGIIAYQSNLTKMDSNLNIVWQLTHEEIYPTLPDNGLDGSDLILTEDEGYIITSYIFDDFFSGVFMSKYDSEGNRLWGGGYPGDVLPMTYLHQVKEVSDGLVVLGGNRFTEEIWLVKLYLDGNWVTSTEDLAKSETMMTVFPNPGHGNLHIKFTEQVNGQVNILNSQGQTIKKTIVRNMDFVQQFLSDFPNGFYGVQFIDKNGYQTTVKYIKN